LQAETTAPKLPLKIQLIDYRDPTVRTNPREIGPIREEAENLCLHETAWWGWEDSNLQPSGYERATLAEKVCDYWHFREALMTYVRVWLRGTIGYLLVGPIAVGHENVEG